MKTYYDNLMQHPGLPYAAILTASGAAAGAGRAGIKGALAFGLVMSVFWIPVLLTTPRGKQ